RVLPESRALFQRCLVRTDGGLLYPSKRAIKTINTNNSTSDITSMAGRRPRGRRASTGGNGALDRQTATASTKNGSKSSSLHKTRGSPVAKGHIGSYSDSEIEETADKRSRIRTRRRYSASRYGKTAKEILPLRKQTTKSAILSSSLPSSPLTSDIEEEHSDLEDIRGSQLPSRSPNNDGSMSSQIELSHTADTAGIDASASNVATEEQDNLPTDSDSLDTRGAKEAEDGSNGFDAAENERADEPGELEQKQEQGEGNEDGNNNNNSNNNEDGEEEEDDEDEDEEEDDGVVRCVCGERNDGELMIECEICQVWQHTLCMGIRDEKHIPDKYYCEKCRPEDHPYINSRPRTIVLAEASALGTTTMMRRSAVMAVAKMTAREEYRAAAAAAAIAASVAAAATGRSSSGGGRRGSKRSAKKVDGPATQVAAAAAAASQKLGRKARRSKRQAHSAGDGEESSDNDYGDGRKTSSIATDNNTTGSNNDDDATDGTRSNNASSAAATVTRKGNASKRAAANRGTGTDGRSKRRKVGVNSGKSTILDGKSEEQSAMDGSQNGDGQDDGSSPADDPVGRRLDAGPDSGRGRGKGRNASSRDRSVSSTSKAASGKQDPDAGKHIYARSFVASPRRRKTGDGMRGDIGERQRVKSEPGSPRSPSPSLQSLLYGAMADRGADLGADGLVFAGMSGSILGSERPGKRKRGPGSGRGSKHQRLTVSATNSPYLEGGQFSAFHTPNAQQSSAAADSPKENSTENAQDGAARAGSDADDSYMLDERTDDHAQHRQPKHNFPPVEMEDVDGNLITVPSNMLNSHGQPVYSSLSAETMCKIRYPHSKASLYELNRRAKQLLEWLGKTQSEYEHERHSWVQPLGSTSAAAAAAAAAAEGPSQASQPNPMPPSSGGVPKAKRVYSGPLSEAPTSPINPNDWPNDEDYDGNAMQKEAADGGDVKEDSSSGMDAPEQQQKHTRTTVSIMEDLVWRLIRFQETYSS
ncbi:Histone deacetylase complex subunit, partial [Dipsacomyces acuminosporus]